MLCNYDQGRCFLRIDPSFCRAPPHNAIGNIRAGKLAKGNTAERFGRLKEVVNVAYVAMYWTMYRTMYGTMYGQTVRLIGLNSRGIRSEQPP